MKRRAVGERPIRRKRSWDRSQSEGFGSIRQVGIATSIGFPLMVVGSIMVILVIVYAGATGVLIAGGVILLLGLIAAASGRIL